MPILPPEEKKSFGPYVTIEEIGRGPTGRVFKAMNTDDASFVALKVLDASFIDDKQFVSRFQREFRALSLLEHGNLARLIEIGEEDGRPYYAMEFVEGELLSVILDREGKLSLANSLKLMYQLAGGLEIVHAAGLVHRDIKPKNIIVTKDGKPVLLDFGLAKSKRDTILTLRRVVLGTPEYMSPEQIREQALDARSDIYALGIVFYETLTGEVPFHGKSHIATMQMHLKNLVPPINRKVKGMPSVVSQFLAKCLDKDVRGRFKTMRECKETLKEMFEALREGSIDAMHIASETQIKKSIGDHHIRHKLSQRQTREWIVISFLIMLFFLPLGGWFVVKRYADKIKKKEPSQPTVQVVVPTPAPAETIVVEDEVVTDPVEEQVKKMRDFKRTGVLNDELLYGRFYSTKKTKYRSPLYEFFSKPLPAVSPKQREVLEPDIDAWQNEFASLQELGVSDNQDWLIQANIVKGFVLLGEYEKAKQEFLILIQNSETISRKKEAYAAFYIFLSLTGDTERADTVAGQMQGMFDETDLNHFIDILEVHAGS